MGDTFSVPTTTLHTSDSCSKIIFITDDHWHLMRNIGEISKFHPNKNKAELWLRKMIKSGSEREARRFYDGMCYPWCVSLSKGSTNIKKLLFSALTDHEHQTKKTAKFDSLISHYWNNRVMNLFCHFWGLDSSGNSEQHWSRQQRVYKYARQEYILKHLSMAQNEHFLLYALENNLPIPRSRKSARKRLADKLQRQKIRISKTSEGNFENVTMVF